MLKFLIFLLSLISFFSGYTEKQSPRSYLPKPDRFSKAVSSFHKENFLGQGTNILVVELDINLEAAELLKKEHPEFNFMLTPYSPIDHDDTIPHATEVAHVARTIAPKSSIYLATTHDLELALNQSEEKLFISPRIQESHVINYSLGKFSESEIGSTKKIQSLLETLLTRNKNPEEPIIVFAAGNDFIPGGYFKDFEELQANKKIAPQLIVAGAVGHDFQPILTSAGDVSEVQNIFLCTMGEDFITFIDPEGDTIAGTSLSAPMISGSIALLKSAFPTLTLLQIKEVLLESADRSFLRNTAFSSINPKGLVFIYDPKEEKPLADRNIKSYAFSPYFYGKGILNLRSARLYAFLKLKNPGLSPQQLRSQMLRILKKQDGAHATRIQKHVRGYLVRKKLKQNKQ